MRKLIVIAIIIFTLSVGSTESEKKIIGRIVNIAAPGSIIVDCRLTKFSDRCWNPTDEQVEKLESKLFPFIVNRLKNHQQKLRKPLFKYHRQYTGSVWRDNKVIFVRGFLDTPNLSGNRDYLYGVYDVLDGCDTYFIATYNAELESFVDFGGCCGACF